MSRLPDLVDKKTIPQEPKARCYALEIVSVSGRFRQFNEISPTAAMCRSLPPMMRFSVPLIEKADAQN